MPRVHPRTSPSHFPPVLVDCGLHGPFGVARVAHQVPGWAPLVFAAQGVRLKRKEKTTGRKITWLVVVIVGAILGRFSLKYNFREK